MPPLPAQHHVGPRRASRLGAGVRRRFIAVLGVLPLLVGCSPLSALNALSPSDVGSEKVGSGLAYGTDPRQKLDVYTPSGPRKKKPVVVFFYGGSWNNGDRADYAFVGNALASRGFVTIVADYRLVPAVRYPLFIEDGAQAVRWTRDHVEAYGGDPNHIFLMGHSAGAYNAMMVGLAPSFLAKAGVPRSSIKGVAGLSGPYDFLPLDVRATQEAFGQWPRLQETQPITYASPSAPPAFLAHGLSDTLVYPKNTVALAKKLKASGVQVDEHLYEGVGHPGTLVALAKPFRSGTPVLEDVVAFFSRH
jgi:acetyl esterase/lipase